MIQQELKVLRRAACAGDANAFRSAVYKLARRDPQRARQWLFEPSVSAGMSVLDRYLFASTRTEPPKITPRVTSNSSGCGQSNSSTREAGHDDC